MTQLNVVDKILRCHVEQSGDLSRVQVADVRDLQARLEVGVRPVHESPVVITLFITFDDLALAEMNSTQKLKQRPERTLRPETNLCTVQTMLQGMARYSGCTTLGDI